MEVTKEFALNFDGDEVKVGKLKFIVSEATIASTTKIVLEGGDVSKESL